MVGVSVKAFIKLCHKVCPTNILLPQSLHMTALGNPCPKRSLLEEKHRTSLLTRVDILHHTKLVFEVLVLHSR
jgi:hypothetical protein